MKDFKKHTVYDITELAMEKGNYEGCYKNFYLYIDNQDCWYYRVMEGTYEGDGGYTLERDNISIEDLINYIEDDTLENWDYNTYENIDDLMDDLLQGQSLEEINY